MGGWSVTGAMAPSVIWDFNVLLRHHLLSYRYCRFFLVKIYEVK